MHKDIKELIVGTPEFTEQFLQTVGNTSTTAVASQHIYHHSDKDGCTFNIKIERNTKGYNWEVTILGCRTADEARAKRDEALIVINELIEQEQPF